MQFAGLIFAASAATALLQAGVPYTPEAVTVVDGDTLRVDDINARISNLDTPERGGRAECDAEKMLAAIASHRAEILVKGPTIVVWPEGRADRYQRPLVRVTVDGKDWAAILIGENLAVPWAGRQHDWCATGKPPQ